MSTSVIEPGTRLAGRYRLDDRVSEAGGSTFWKATDEILARSVAVLTFAPGFPRVGDVVTAARAASRLTDPRLTQVFDADDGGERAYIVSEWVTGDTLDDLLGQGPMEPDRAAAFLLEAAEALTSAHGAGLAHLCFTPHNLVWTSGATVKITGLGVEAVLSGTASDTPALDDTRGLGRMLYAALTGQWPGAEGGVLPPVPLDPDGRPPAPARVRAGVPHNLDAIVCRTLQLSSTDGMAPLDTPAAFADALAKVPRSPLPFVPLVGSTPPAVVPRPEISERTTALPTPSTQTVPDTVRPRQVSSHTRHSARGDGAVGRPMLAVVAAVAVAVVGLGAWGLSTIGDKGAKSKASAPPSTPSVTKPQARLLKPVKVKAFDPRGADLTARKNPDHAIDGKSSTAWRTQHYVDARYGKLQAGLGLLIDMGSSVPIDKVKVSAPNGGPGVMEVRIGDSGNQKMTTVGTGTGTGVARVDAHHARGQYILLWYPKLPNIGEYRIEITDIEVYGSA